MTLGNHGKITQSKSEANRGLVMEYCQRRVMGALVEPLLIAGGASFRDYTMYLCDKNRSTL